MSALQTEKQMPRELKRKSSLKRVQSSLSYLTPSFRRAFVAAMQELRQTLSLNDVSLPSNVESRQALITRVLNKHIKQHLVEAHERGMRIGTVK